MGQIKTENITPDPFSNGTYQVLYNNTYTPLNKNGSQLFFQNSWLPQSYFNSFLHLMYHSQSPSLACCPRIFYSTPSPPSKMLQQRRNISEPQERPREQPQR